VTNWERAVINPTGEVRRVADTILGRILDGSYPCGLRLPAEASLADELDCGRSTVREALRYLADLGLVRSRQGSGAMVLDFRRQGTPALLPAYVRAGRFERPAAVMAREMLRLRTLMACEAVRLAARYASPEGLGEARQLLEQAPDLEADPAAHALNELEIYRSLVMASGVWPAVWMVNAFWAPMREVNALFAPLGAVPPTFQDTMARLLGLVAAGDEEAAMALVRGWFEAVDRELVKLLELAMGSERERDVGK
jgi:DNA-binding FadR family transcriptional regulator